MGSSPLTRGKRKPRAVTASGFGLIPAHAGKTACGSVVVNMTGAHPRSRGENPKLPGIIVPIWGSSPLTRGKHGGGHRAVQHDGLIPAHAGKTSFVFGVDAPPGAHPRSRGENGTRHYQRAFRAGSSPLTRGKPVELIGGGDDRGLIPAHAGKTGVIPANTVPDWAHPRSRGENNAQSVAAATGKGSSPLTRGKRALWRTNEKYAGLIPAHAGKTTRRPGRVEGRRAHPRSRGENTS